MIVMSIAGADPSAGAGVYADLKTFQALGVYGCGVITALTAQNPHKMFSVKEIDAYYVCSQIDAVMDAYDITYIKTGMLYSTEIIKAVSEKITEYNLKAVVDPVMAATSGGELAKNDLARSLNRYLLSNAVLTTPNISEAEKLTGVKITNPDDAIKASEKLPCNSIITGGHLDGIDTVNIDGKITSNKQKLIKTDNLHGTGCVLSSAITANLAKGEELQTAITKSSYFVRKSIKNGKYGTLITK